MTRLEVIRERIIDDLDKRSQGKAGLSDDDVKVLVQLLRLEQMGPASVAVETTLTDETVAAALEALRAKRAAP